MERYMNLKIPGISQPFCQPVNPEVTGPNGQLIKPKVKPRTLLQLGFKPNEIEEWKSVAEPSKQSLYGLLRNMIEQNIKPNVHICIGNMTFKCHRIVLQCYSEYFMDCDPNDLVIKLPEERITFNGFVMMYNWMLADKPLIQPDNILELFNAANFLRVRELINQCWFCFDDYTYYCEDKAFNLYWEARKYNLERLEQLMLTRICKFFLCLVASQEFLLLTANAIITLFNSNSIGVNTEVEIFMSAIRWLDYNWEERKQYVLDIIKTVRFNLMPPLFLIALTEKSNCIEIDRLKAFPEFNKLISDAISYNATRAYYGHNRLQFLYFVQRFNFVIPMEREWIFDKECPYHSRADYSKVEIFTYTAFLEYLKHIDEIGKKDYWHHLEINNKPETADQVNACSNKHKTFDMNFRVLPTGKCSDQGHQCENATNSYKKNMVNSKLQNEWYDNTKNAMPHHLRRIDSPHFITSVSQINCDEIEAGQMQDNRLRQEQQEHVERKTNNHRKMERQNYDFEHQHNFEPTDIMFCDMRNNNTNNNNNTDINKCEHDKNNYKERERQRAQIVQYHYHYRQQQQQEADEEEEEEPGQEQEEEEEKRTNQSDNRSLRVCKIYPPDTIRNAAIPQSNLDFDTAHFRKYAANINIESCDFNKCRIDDKGNIDDEMDAKTAMKDEQLSNIRKYGRNRKNAP